MSFWALNDGTTAESNTSFESGGGDFDPIPANTGCIAAIEEAKWDEYEGDRFINLKWRVMKPSEYEKRVIFQKIKVFGTARDKDKKATSDKAKRMLAAIDANAGGKLLKLGAEPSDMDLMSALVGKMMAIKVMIWKMKGEDGEERVGNWISAVAPAKGGAASKPAPKSVESKPAVAGDDFDPDSDIPF